MQALSQQIYADVKSALAEDIGEGDISAALIPASSTAQAAVTSRQAGVICGTAWVDEVFAQMNAPVCLNWLVHDGDQVSPDSLLLQLTGSSRALLTGERTALNFLQLLSGTATRCAYYASIVEGTGARLLDTRKTIPGLRRAQKYAVTCGGCYNHRIGLYDAFLIKENHIESCGSITAAIETARRNEPDKPVAVEVESFAEMEEALAAAADRIMLDNFDLDGLRQAVAANQGRAELEASGGITDETLRAVAETGIDFISIGTLTKDIDALDLSMRLSAS